MLIKIPRGWELPESAATPEAIFRDRRRLAKALAAGPILAATAPLATLGGAPVRADSHVPWADLYPVERNPEFTLGDRPMTPQQDALTYNNFYEFGSHKQISRAAQAMQIEPWTVRFDGMVEQERDVDFDTLIKAMPLEERLYRHRCVEAWSMAVPWSGFAMKHLVAYAKPLSSAKYVVMETAQQQGKMPGLRQFWYPWPYTEGLTIEEATHELAFMATGLYGVPMPKQNGAPLRLAVPWKYGFKSVKSIVRFHFTDERPVTFWEKLAPEEYGFWANVNPEVSHPRWSQASEWWLGGSQNDRHPTALYNGYGEFVAGLYSGMKGERLFM
ncbi:MAG: protein-methionine-sulfoxide reductase catalytic subunit MsrP [Alphaproteobacteria bacterium]|jgi:sulfoxide reductase catalytic subunit YedY